MSPERRGGAVPRWAPDQVDTRSDLCAALRDIYRGAGFGYKAFETKAKRLVQNGMVPATGYAFATNPLPDSSLQRAIAEGNLRWFAAAPDRLAVFLRVAGRPEPEIDQWLDRLRALAEPPDSDPPDSELPGSGPPDAGPPVPPAGWNGRARRRALVAAVPLLAVGVITLVVVAGYAQFYGALGLDVEELPVGAGRLVVSGLFATLLVGGATVFVLGAAATGLALVPWTARTRATVPAAAVLLFLLTAGYFALSVALGDAAVVPWVGLGVLVLAGHYRLLARQSSAHVFIGWAVGLPAAAALAGVALAVGRWQASKTWLLAVFLTGAVAVLSGLRWWITRELRRDGLDEPGDTSPAGVLRQLKADLPPFTRAGARRTMPGWQARRFVISIGLFAILLPGAAVWYVASELARAADAGQAAREYGYVPDEYGSLIWPASIRPATVTPRRSGADPAGVCGPSSWSASLISQDGEGSWVLLRRPAGPGTGPVEVVRLAAADYTVRPVLDPGIRDGEPWTRPACPP
jgi:hypothetical protein